MAWTLVTPNGTGGAGGGTGAGITLTKPAGVADGHLLVAVTYIDDSSRTWTGPAGWNTSASYIASNPGGVGVGHNTQVWWKIASGEPASWTWTPSSSGFRNVAVAAFTGGTGNTTMVDVAGTAGQGDAISPDSSQTAPSVTTLTANDLVIFAYSNQSGANPAALTGFATSLAVADVGLTIGSATNASASATGTTAPNGGVGTDNYAAIHVAFLLTGTGGALATFVPPTIPDKPLTRPAAVARQTTGTWFPATLPKPWDASQFARTELWQTRPLVRAVRYQPNGDMPRGNLNQPKPWDATQFALAYGQNPLRRAAAVTQTTREMRTGVISTATTPTGWDYRDPMLPKRAARVLNLDMSLEDLGLEQWVPPVDSWLPSYRDNPPARARGPLITTWEFEDLDWIMGGAASFLGPKAPLVRAKALQGPSYVDPAFPVVVAVTPTDWRPTLPEGALRSARRIVVSPELAEVLAVEQWATALGWAAVLPTSRLQGARRTPNTEWQARTDQGIVVATPNGWFFVDPTLPKRAKGPLTIETLKVLGLEKFAVTNGWWPALPHRMPPRRVVRPGWETTAVFVPPSVPGLVRRPQFGRAGRRGMSGY